MRNLKRVVSVLVGSIVMVGSANADQVFLDDIIVDGSACIGFDCVNGESFGFDTLRLKENNLRIKAQDTSTSASFPTNDWQITFNDTSNGGANKFSIDDIDGGRTPLTIEASAPSHSLYVDDGGRLGFGTNQPVADLHVKSGNTPTLRLEQDGSSGFTAQTWDLAGNEANIFIRDATNGSTLPFRIRPGAPTSAIDMAASGDVGFGTSSPAEPVHISRSDATPTRLAVQNTNASAQNVDVDFINVTATWRMRNNTLGSFVINDTSDGNFEVEISPAGDMTLEGGLITGTVAGTCNPGPCDATFQPDKFTVPSIEDHAEYMWENSHLWAVGPTREGTPMNLTKKTGGIIHELEVAHIYIEQLNEQIKQLQQEKDATISSFEERLSKLENK